MRSPTAADLAARWEDIETDFAGLSSDADERLSAEQVEWADIIFVMERRHRKRLNQLYPKLLKSKHVVCLNIPDKFRLMDERLIALLEPALRRSLRR